MLSHTLDKPNRGIECTRIYNKVFIQASGLACEVCVEVSPLRSLPTTVCEVKVCLLFLILCY